MRDRCINVDALNASTRDAGERGHLDLTVTGPSENLNLVAFEHVDHPFPRCVVQRVCDPKGSTQYGQNFLEVSAPEFPEKWASEFPEPARLGGLLNHYRRAA